jgi:hypothetical protein
MAACAAATAAAATVCCGRRRQGRRPRAVDLEVPDDGVDLT